MKYITYVRHAKSSWKELGLSDFERPLNKRGKRDAPIMASIWKKTQPIPEILITSPANRALSTCKIFQKELQSQSIEQHSSLYHAGEEELKEVIYIPDPSIKHIMVFAHNPGLTYLANSYSSEYIDNIPTCGIFTIQSRQEAWASFFEDAMLSLFIYPKMYQ